MKAICTTTINAPTKALLKFIEIAERDDWRVYIAGDNKTPDKEFKELEQKYESVRYLSLQTQRQKWPNLSELIGENCIQRRNFAMLQAWTDGAELTALVDDDNIPLPNWGKNVVVNKELSIILQRTDCEVFDPLSVTHPNIWHRGFPVQLLDQRNLKTPTRRKMKILVQADFWEGDPDVDAICRISLAPMIKFNPSQPMFAGDKISPFNSQNSFISREVMMTYFLFPHIGRMDDIWAAYMTQAIHPDSVVYGPASVFQDRNEHDLVKDLEAEMIGYKHSLDFVKWCLSKDRVSRQWPEYMPQKAIEAYTEWHHQIAQLDR